MTSSQRPAARNGANMRHPAADAAADRDRSPVRYSMTSNRAPNRPETPDSAHVAVRNTAVGCRRYASMNVSPATTASASSITPPNTYAVMGVSCMTFCANATPPRYAAPFETTATSRTASVSVIRSRRMNGGSARCAGALGVVVWSVCTGVSSLCSGRDWFPDLVCRPYHMHVGLHTGCAERAAGRRYGCKRVTCRTAVADASADCSCRLGCRGVHMQRPVAHVLCNGPRSADAGHSSSAVGTFIALTRYTQQYDDSLLSWILYQVLFLISSFPEMSLTESAVNAATGTSFWLLITTSRERTVNASCTLRCRTFSHGTAGSVEVTAMSICSRGIRFTPASQIIAE